MQIATNPQTGEKVQWNGSAWVPLGGPVTVGTPKPKAPKVQEVGGSLGIVGDDGSFTPTYTPPEKPKEDKTPTDGAKAAAGYYARALRAHKGYGGGVAPRGGLTQMVVDHLPQPLVDENTSPQRKAAENFADEFIRAKLRRESGASIPPDEMAQEYRVYFPVPGDTEEDIKRKAGLRQQAIEALRNEAGGAADTITVDPVTTPNYDAAFAGAEKASNEGSLPELVAQSKDGPAAQEAARLAALKANTGAGTAAVMGAGDTLTFGLSDEIDAGLHAFRDSLAGQGSIGDLYNDYVATNRAYQDSLQQDHGGAYLTGQLVGGLAVPFGAGAKGAAQFAKVGAAQGAAYGFGSGEGNALARTPGAVVGGFVGGAVGAGIGKAAPAIGNAMSRFTPSATRDAEIAAARPVIEAGQRQGIPIRQPDVRPGLRGDMAAVEKSPSAGPMVGDTLNADRELVAGRVKEVAGPGEAKDGFAFGEQLQGAVNRHGERTKDQALLAYHRAKVFAPQHAVPPVKTTEAIDQRILQLRDSGETANAAEIKVLEGIKNDLGKSGLSVDSLQAQRRAMRQRLKDNGIDSGSADAAYMEVMKVAGAELENSLQPNPRALQALRHANGIWAERSAFRQDVARKFIGTKNMPVAPETAASRFLSMAKNKGDYNRFSKMLNEMDGTDKEDLAATVAEGLGRGRNGEFAYGRFVSDLEGMNPRALRDMFGEDGAKALEDLKAISRAKSGTAGGLNHSNTGSVMTRDNGFRDVLLGIFGGGVAGAPGAVAGYFARGAVEKFTSKRAARMLLNPDFTKWLRTTPASTKPGVINKHFARLSSLAAKNPAIAGDAQALQQFLRESLAAPVTKAAAQGNETDNSRQE